jgi:O-succinylhomoserine sulfhydrylase
MMMRPLSKCTVLATFTLFAGRTLNTWHSAALKGLETLPIRMRAHSENALALAQWLEANPKVAKVNYPFLDSHPAVTLAKRQQSGGGAVLSFTVKGGKAEAWKVVDAVKIMSITGNLGDVKTTITHPASTTHSRMTQAARDASGITDTLIRVAVGLESQFDLQEDLNRGLSAI